jgi:hypothetical protein
MLFFIDIIIFPSLSYLFSSFLHPHDISFYLRRAAIHFHMYNHPLFVQCPIGSGTPFFILVQYTKYMLTGTV